MMVTFVIVNFRQMNQEDVSEFTIILYMLAMC